MERPLVVLADDEVLTRMCLVCALQSEYEVFEAANGVEALQKIDQYPEQVMALITDIHMPMMDGWELLARVTARGFDGLVIAMSSEMGIEQDVRWTDYPQVRVLSKPVEADQLKRVLASGR